MKSRSALHPWAKALLAVILAAGAAQAQGDDPTALARRILNQSGVQGGIIVHLGSGDGKLTAALRAGDGYAVQGLEADPAKVVQARDYLKSKGLYGPVSVEQFSGAALPCTDNLINLVVVQNPGSVPMAEDLFVANGLVWRGILCVDEDGKPVNKSPNALALGWDLRTGEEKKRILVRNLRSPEHHHRCCRNKATTQYLISSYEGAECLSPGPRPTRCTRWRRRAARRCGSSRRADESTRRRRSSVCVPGERHACVPGREVGL